MFDWFNKKRSKRSGEIRLLHVFKFILNEGGTPCGKSHQIHTGTFASGAPLSYGGARSLATSVQSGTWGVAGAPASSGVSCPAPRTKPRCPPPPATAKAVPLQLKNN